MNILLNISNNITTYASTGSGPDFSGLNDLIMSWVNPILSLIFIIVGVISLINLITIGVRILKEKDPNARQEHMKSLGYWFLGLVITALAALVVNVIFPIIFDNISLDISTN